jgi:hypothetical protein
MFIIKNQIKKENNMSVSATGAAVNPNIETVQETVANHISSLTDSELTSLVQQVKSRTPALADKSDAEIVANLRNLQTKHVTTQSMDIDDSAHNAQINATLATGGTVFFNPATGRFE